MDMQSIPQMFFERARSRGAQTAQLVKRGTMWQEISWQTLSQVVRHIAQGLLELDVQPGERVAILADSRAEWVQCDLGILATGGITVPIYPSSTPEQVAYILQNSAATIVCVDTPAQLQKVLVMRQHLPVLRQIVLMDGAASATEPLLLSLHELQGRGAAATAQEAVLAQRLHDLRPEHEATYVYTSGTTGPPKGVVQTHGNHLFMMQSCGSILPAQAGDVHLLFLPLAHAFARMEEFLGLYMGLVTAFAESIDALAQDMREVRPVFIFSVPRVYEKIYNRVLAAGTSGSWLQQAIFRWCLKVGRRVSQRQQQHQPVPRWMQYQYRLAHALVFHKLHDSLGGRVRFFVSGGAPLARDIAEFFHAAGMLLLEGYGLTETCPALTANRYTQYKFGTVGPALPGVELRIASDGEILGRGPNIAKGYYQRPEDTAAVFLEDGWFATGDIGEIDADGFVRITDRKKDLIVTAGGKNIAPQNIENLLKTDPYISQSMVYGDRQPYLTAVITLDVEETQRYARAQGLAVQDPEALAAHPQIQHLIQQRLEGLNQQLAPYETIKKFLIAPQDFSQENGELTPTLKVKRKVVTQKYQEALDRLYT